MHHPLFPRPGALPREAFPSYRGDWGQRPSTGVASHKLGHGPFTLLLVLKLPTRWALNTRCMILAFLLRGAHRGDLVLYALRHLRIWTRINLLRLESRAVVTLLVGALRASRAVFHVRWELVVALVASVVRYRLCSECISRVPVWVLVSLGTVMARSASEYPGSRTGSRLTGLEGSQCTAHVRTWHNHAHRPGI